MAHLLIYARERRLRGTMEFGANGSTASLVFLDGFVAKVATSGGTHTTDDQAGVAIRSLFALPGATSFAYYDRYD
ncbi:MAG: hypothetical protein ABI461_10955, partial [Polyangiaceae bacterium]